MFESIGSNTTVSESETGPEAELAKGMVLAVLLSAPFIVLVAALVWGHQGLYSALYGILLVTINFAVAAKGLSWGGRISPVALMAVAMGSFFFDLLLLTAAVLPVVHAGWMDLKALGMALIVSHIFAVSWEARRVTAYLAYGGIRPRGRRS
ncbi:MAG: hypothetical protein HKL82_07980 [Acidimicrobiaceae bacterium]|nr:hypothetical protein [Acidimicrobiaceae bacterium]